MPSYLQWTGKSWFLYRNHNSNILFGNFHVNDCKNCIQKLKIVGNHVCFRHFNCNKIMISLWGRTLLLWFWLTNIHSTKSQMVAFWIHYIKIAGIWPIQINQPFGKVYSILESLSESFTLETNEDWMASINSILANGVTPFQK